MHRIFFSVHSVLFSIMTYTHKVVRYIGTNAVLSTESQDEYFLKVLGEKSALMLLNLEKKWPFGI